MVGLRRRAVLCAVAGGIMGVTFTSGCFEAVRGSSGLKAAAVLGQAGDVIAKARYVDIFVEYRERRGDQIGVIPVSMLFGPGKRMRVERFGDFAFYDGTRIGRPDPVSGELRTMVAPARYASPIMFVGTIMGGVTLPMPAAREFGRKWWEHLYGDDALLDVRDPEVVNGRMCYVVGVQPQQEKAHVVWRIAQDTHLFVSFEVVGSTSGTPPQGIVAGEYKTVRFPRRIEESRFNAPKPRGHDCVQE